MRYCFPQLCGNSNQKEHNRHSFKTPLEINVDHLEQSSRAGLEDVSLALGLAKRQDGGTGLLGREIKAGTAPGDQ